MKNQAIFILFFCTISFCQAQISIGPTIGLNYSFVKFQESTLKKLPITSSYEFDKRSKPAYSVGFKTEIPVNRTFFISLGSNYFKSRHRAYDCHFRCETWYSEFNHILVRSSLNYILPKQFSVGFGVNYLRGIYKYSFDTVMMPKFKDLGVVLSGNYKFNQFILELFYIHSLKSYGTKLSDDTFFIKPIHNLQLSISYLFKIKFNSGEKEIKCPRF